MSQEEESEKNRATRANSKANRIEPARQIHISSRTARARYAAHTPRPWPHTSRVGQ
jgi:hypothetical protein